MSTWFYYDSSGQKQGPVTGGRLKGLAQAGLITPETMVETEKGKTVPAKKVKGLKFLVAMLPESPFPAEPGTYSAIPPAAATERSTGTEERIGISDEKFELFLHELELEEDSMHDSVSGAELAQNTLRTPLERHINTASGFYNHLDISIVLCGIVCWVNAVIASLCVMTLILTVATAVRENYTFSEFMTQTTALFQVAAIIGFFQAAVFFYALSAVCHWMIHVGRNVQMIQKK